MKKTLLSLILVSGLLTTPVLSIVQATGTGTGAATDGYTSVISPTHNEDGSYTKTITFANGTVDTQYVNADGTPWTAPEESSDVEGEEDTSEVDSDEGTDTVSSTEESSTTDETGGSLEDTEDKVVVGYVTVLVKRDGEVVIGENVSLRDDNGNRIGRATNDEGKARFDVIVGDTYTLKVFGQLHTFIATEASSKVFDLTGIELELPPAATDTILEDERALALDELAVLEFLSNDEYTVFAERLVNAETVVEIREILAEANALNTENEEFSAELLDAKLNAIDEIYSLELLSDNEKSIFILRVYRANDIESVDTIVAESKALNTSHTDLAATKEHVAAVIVNLEYLSEDEVADLLRKLEEANTIDVAEALEEQAVELNDANRLEVEEAQALAQDKIEAISDLNDLDYLTVGEVKGFVERINAAETTEAIDLIVDEAVALNTEAKEVTEALVDAKESAYTEILALENLTNQEVAILLARIDNATSLAEVQDILEEAREMNVVESDDDSSESTDGEDESDESTDDESTVVDNNDDTDTDGKAVAVDVESGEEDLLPNTGESTSYLLFGGIGLALLGVLSLILPRTRKE